MVEHMQYKVGKNFGRIKKLRGTSVNVSTCDRKLPHPASICTLGTYGPKTSCVGVIQWKEFSVQKRFYF